MTTDDRPAPVSLMSSTASDVLSRSMLPSATAPSSPSGLPESTSSCSAQPGSVSACVCGADVMHISGNGQAWTRSGEKETGEAFG